MGWPCGPPHPPNPFQFCLGRSTTALPESVLETAGPAVLGCVTRLLLYWNAGLREGGGGDTKQASESWATSGSGWCGSWGKEQGSQAQPGARVFERLHPNLFPFVCPVETFSPPPTPKQTNKTNMGQGNEVPWNCLWRLKLANGWVLSLGQGEEGPYSRPGLY